MKKSIMLIAVLGCFGWFVFVCDGGMPAQGFFRIQGPTNTAITGFTSTGLLTWTNAAVGDACSVQWLGSLGASNDWKIFVQYPVTSTVCQVQVFIPSVPTGMAFIATSRFQMGNCMGAGDGANADESPLHNVYVTPFYMDQVEVTKAQWDDVYGWATNHGYGFANIGFGKGTNYPVESVSWFDVVKWCNARSEKESLTPVYNTYEVDYDEFGDPIGTNIVVFKSGESNITSSLVYWTANGYRLPTEAEWELAARGGMAGHRFPWAGTDTITQTNANYYSFGDGGATYFYDMNPTEGYPFFTGDFTEPFTSPVATFLPNPYGLYDMAGNVREWCWDWYDDALYLSSNATENDTKGPQGQIGGYGRVVRGGSWLSGAFEARSSWRYNQGPDGSSNDLGFRCVRSR